MSTRLDPFKIHSQEQLETPIKRFKDDQENEFSYEDVISLMGGTKLGSQNQQIQQRSQSRSSSQAGILQEKSGIHPQHEGSFFEVGAVLVILVGVAVVAGKINGRFVNGKKRKNWSPISSRVIPKKLQQETKTSSPSQATSSRKQKIQHKTEKNKNPQILLSPKTIQNERCNYCFELIRKGKCKIRRIVLVCAGYTRQMVECEVKSLKQECVQLVVNVQYALYVGMQNVGTVVAELVFYIRNKFDLLWSVTVSKSNILHQTDNSQNQTPPPFADSSLCKVCQNERKNEKIKELSLDSLSSTHQQTTSCTTLQTSKGQKIKQDTNTESTSEESINLLLLNSIQRYDCGSSYIEEQKSLQLIGASICRPLTEDRGSEPLQSTPPQKLQNNLTQDIEREDSGGWMPVLQGGKPNYESQRSKQLVLIKPRHQDTSQKTHQGSTIQESQQQAGELKKAESFQKAEELEEDVFLELESQYQQNVSKEAPIHQCESCQKSQQLQEAVVCESESLQRQEEFQEAIVCKNDLQLQQFSELKDEINIQQKETQEDHRRLQDNLGHILEQFEEDFKESQQCNDLLIPVKMDDNQLKQLEDKETITKEDLEDRESQNAPSKSLSEDTDDDTSKGNKGSIKEQKIINIKPVDNIQETDVYDFIPQTPPLASDVSEQASTFTSEENARVSSEDSSSISHPQPPSSDESLGGHKSPQAVLQWMGDFPNTNTVCFSDTASAQKSQIARKQRLRQNRGRDWSYPQRTNNVYTVAQPFVQSDCNPYDVHTQQVYMYQISYDQFYQMQNQLQWQQQWQKGQYNYYQYQQQWYCMEPNIQFYQQGYVQQQPQLYYCQQYQAFDGHQPRYQSFQRQRENFRYAGLQQSFKRDDRHQNKKQQPRAQRDEGQRQGQGQAQCQGYPHHIQEQGRKVDEEKSTETLNYRERLFGRAVRERWGIPQNSVQDIQSQNAMIELMSKFQSYGPGTFQAPKQPLSDR